ncbi:MAG: hypothetical protein AAGC54_16380, partial [Cyanobacteria bacterium P01_F01_bin.4]
MLSKVPDQLNRASKKLDFHFRSVYKRPDPIPLGFVDRQIIRDLKREGVSMKSLQTIDIKGVEGFLSSVKKASLHLPVAATVTPAAERSAASHGVGVDADMLLQYPDIFLWGLQEKWLTLIEHYFQQPIAYLGCMLRRDIPNQRQTGIRFWHRDGEDYRVLKILIYLNDVDELGGPFEYIPRKVSPSYRSFRRQSSLIRDQQMARVVDRDLWKKCTGPEGTILIADTVSIFHHATIPQRDRLALTFAYTSAKPKNLKQARQFFSYSDRAAWLYAQQLMSSRQKQVAV